MTLNLWACAVGAGLMLLTLLCWFANQAANALWVIAGAGMEASTNFAIQAAAIANGALRPVVYVQLPQDPENNLLKKLGHEDV